MDNLVVGICEMPAELRAQVVTPQRIAAAARSGGVQCGDCMMEMVRTDCERVAAFTLWLLRAFYKFRRPPL
ncbi:MAG: hypothetical protein RL701_3619 [Pseudomonadota bacterium]|jgi:hypothetical protein